MPKLIIHTATRIIRCMTTDQNPPMLAFESAVDVADGYQLTGRKKLDLDNVTQVDFAAQEKSDALDDYFPQRAKKRDLLAKLDDIIGDATIGAKVRQLCNLLKNYFGTNVPGDFE